MRVIAIVALFFAATEAVRRPLPYAVYVAHGGLPLPERLREVYQWYTPEDVYNNSKIVGGDEAKAGECPFAVALRTSYQFCGGSIYNPQTIVTAAHCLDGFSAASVSVRSGSLNSGSGGVLTQASRLIMHGSYSSSTIDNDIGVIQLATPIETTGQQSQAVAIAKEDPADGNDVLVCGWGSTQSGGSTTPNLRHVTVPTVNRAECNSAYSGSVTNNMICAGLKEGGKDSCQGDSGGPLVDPDTGNLAGIVSWGRGCALAGYPGVYTRAANYVDWVAQNAA